MRRVLVAMAVALLALVPMATMAGAQSAQVSIVGQAYVPVIVSVVVGDSVTWTNNDAETHSVNLGDVFGDQLILPGQTYTVTFPNAGEYPYFCTLHGHAGKVVVNSTPDTTAAPPSTTPPKPPTTRPKPTPPPTTAPRTTAAPTTPAPPPTTPAPTTPSVTTPTTPATSAVTSTPETTAVDSTVATTDDPLPPPISVVSASGAGPGIPTGLLAGGAVIGAGAGIGGGMVMRKRAARRQSP